MSGTMVITKPHVALLSSPGMGHLIPMLELGKRLLTHHALDVTVFVVATDSSTTHSQILEQTSKMSSLNVVILPPVDVSSKLGPNPALGARLGLTMEESLPLLRSAILSMKLAPTALIVDLFGTNALSIARDLGMLTFVFLTSTAWLLALTIYTPVMDKEMLHRHLNHHELLLIPGCKPVRFEDTLEPLLLYGSPVYDGLVQMGLDMSIADGILVNTWKDLEPTALRALRDKDILGWIIKGPVYPVGPLVRTVQSRSNRDQDKVLNWLNGQPAESVIYVSFGSGGTFSAAQITELAWGLELSQQRFVWVVRPPKEDGASGSFFSVPNGDYGAPNYLPEGFLRRTHNVGVVVPMSAPQLEILGHSSTGAFLTHCGWNSTLESITNGVAMVAWPLYAEQMMNAAMLSEELGVALRVKGKNGIMVGREEIRKLITRIMVEEEGKAMRARVKELKQSAEKALSEDGSYYDSLRQLATHFEIYQRAPLAKASGAN